MQTPKPRRPSRHNLPRRASLAVATVAAVALLGLPVGATGGPIVFEALDHAAAGLGFTRVPGPRIASYHAIQAASLVAPIHPSQLPLFPIRVYGLTGVAALDVEGDGDLDVYVTNGPGGANALFINQLVETGTLGFVDRGTEAGVDAVDMESAGTCFGDFDNDGDPDLLVLGTNEPRRLFENLGDGTFAQVVASGLEGGDTSSSSCSVGDVDGDGLLDVFIGAAWDMATLFPIFVDPFGENQPNELYLGDGSLGFTDVSASAGIRELVTLPPGVATITWAVAMVDLDLDGDLDLVQADDQGAYPNARDGGIDRGLVHVFENDGTGYFSNRPVILDEQAAGAWMGLGFGDLDCDGALDILGSNFGDYGLPIMEMPYLLGDQATRWFLGNGDLTYSQPGPGNLVSSAFGWGNAVADFDLDGDQDMLYLGGLLAGPLSLADNPGAVLENIGCGHRFELRASATGVDYRPTPISGVALADLDRDHRPDFVAAAEVEMPGVLPLIPAPIAYGGPFDAGAGFVPVFFATPAGFVWTGAQVSGGRVYVERNAGHGRGTTVSTLGTVGLVDGGRVNRDGIGAVLSFRPRGGKRAQVPIVGGSSHASQHALEAYFGLGHAPFGTLEVLWPGGVRNRLYRVRARENLRMPEIPCSFDQPGQGLGAYLGCVLPALGQLRAQGLISHGFKFRLFVSALRAYFDAH